jgi:hypothetical protein
MPLLVKIFVYRVALRDGAMVLDCRPIPDEQRVRSRQHREHESAVILGKPPSPCCHSFLSRCTTAKCGICHEGTRTTRLWSYHVSLAEHLTYPDLLVGFQTIQDSIITFRIIARFHSIKTETKMCRRNSFPSVGAHHKNWRPPHGTCIIVFQRNKWGIANRSNKPHKPQHLFIQNY